MYLGLDLLALAMMDAKMLSQAMKPGCSFGFLMGTFGDALPNAEYLLKHNQPPAVRVHLSNGPCARNHNCGEGELSPCQTPAFIKRAQKVEALAKTYPHTKFYISPRVEHDEEVPWCKLMLRILLDDAPSCIPVLSCGPKGATYQGYLTEDHGNDACGAIISNDGESIFDAPKNWAVGDCSTMALAWDYSCNFNVKGGPFVPPRKRDLSHGPTHDILVRMQEAIGL